VLLGCPYSTQIDVWSFGCVLFEMYTGQPLFNGKDPEDQLLKIVDLLGQPPDCMKAQQQFFMPGTKEGDRIAAAGQAGATPQGTRGFADRFRAIGYACITRRKRAEGVTLADDVKTDKTGRVVDENLLQFLDLVTKCLDLDPASRIQPAQALRHPFCQQVLQAQAKDSPRDTEEQRSSKEASSATTTKGGDTDRKPAAEGTEEPTGGVQVGSEGASESGSTMQVDSGDPAEVTAADHLGEDSTMVEDSATTGLEGSVSSHCPPSSL